jgi:hypothetical protein
MNLNLRWLFIAAIALSTSLVGPSGAVLAQPVDVDIDSGADGGCTASGPPSDQLTVCRDLRPGSGRAVNEPGAAAKEVTPTPAPEPAPASDAEPAPETTDMAVASATDQDADNALDESEPGLGLDPTNPDTDADGVADGDEPNIYGTDALNADTDGDGVSDGEELFGIHTDPLVADNASTQGSEATTDAP